MRFRLVRKRVTGGVTLGVVVFCVCVAALGDYDYDGSCTSPYDTVTLGDHTIRFCGRTYDEGADESTWYYSVTSGTAPAVSHWVLALCVEHSVLDAGPGTVWGVGRDATLGIYGIKWEDGLEDGETRLYWVTLAGNWVVEDVQVGVKAGSDEYESGYYILGPSCTPYVPPFVEVTVSGLTDLTVTQPLIGDWASNPAQLKQSLGDLTVTVVANVNYEVDIYYSVSPAPSPAFLGDPLAFEYPTGTWTTIPSWPSMAPLPGLSGTQTRDYPVAVDLLLVGDREAGEAFTFTVYVVVSEMLGP